MNQIKKNSNTQERQEYVPAKVTMIEVTTHAVLCQSGGISGMTIDPDGGEDFE